MPTEECYEECEILTSIYSDTEISIEHDKPKKDESLISMVLFPSTGDDETTRHVTITLEFVLPPRYPDVVPQITFRNPRGLSEIKLEQLQVTVVKKSEELIGSSMMFQIRDIVQDFLTGNNRPASECPICLLSFTDFDVFFRTDCYHHYHSKCLGTYLQNVITTFKTAGEHKMPNEKLVLCCPVCRKELDPATDVENLLSAPPPSEESQEDAEDADEEVTLSLPAEWLGKREKLKALYQKQKEQGGIIDLTEKNKKLLVISGTSSTNSASLAEGGMTSTTTTTTPSIDPPILSSMPPPPPPAKNTKDNRRMVPPNNGTTTAGTMTHSHSQRGNHPRQIYCPPRERSGEDGHSRGGGHTQLGSRQMGCSVYRERERTGEDGLGHGGHTHGHYNRHRTHHRGGYHHSYNNGTSNNGPDSKGGRNTIAANASAAAVPTSAELPSESQSQNKVTSHGHGRSHGQGHNRERRRAK